MLNQNCFANNYLIEGRASKYYKNFIETLYGYTELTKSTLQYEEILKMPYPVFYDYLNFVISQKKAEAAKQQRQINEMKK